MRDEQLQGAKCEVEPRRPDPTALDMRIAEALADQLRVTLPERWPWVLYGFIVGSRLRGRDGE